MGQVLGDRERDGHDHFNMGGFVVHSDFLTVTQR